ncbi:hypothetical protein WSM22_25880 [Cytophagales bacterium WSM2-2]|nr:hypothetical protein WSM22_25880 [Cytophagales bacterium WSM2-2]
MLYNILKYVEWPQDGVGDKIVVGVYGEQNVLNSLKSTYEGRLIGSRKIVVKEIKSLNESADCSVFITGKGKSRDLETIIKYFGGKSVLLVTNKNGDANRGSCLNFVEVDGKLKFEINKAKIASANLKVSSAILSMAILI